MTRAAGRLLRGSARPLVLGHRGSRLLHPENTLAAFEQSRLEGADGTEFDVQLSADRQPFVIHDEMLSRVTAGRHKDIVSQCMANELDKVELSRGLTIPRLSQVLDWAGRSGQLLNIELKSFHPQTDAVAQVVADVLRQASANLRSAIIVSSFHPELLLQFHSLAPQLAIGFLYDKTSATQPQDQKLAPLGACALHPAASLIRPQSHPAPTKRPINCWTVNEIGQARALAPHVNAIISDCPGELIRHFAGRDGKQN